MRFPERFIRYPTRAHCALAVAPKLLSRTPMKKILWTVFALALIGNSNAGAQQIQGLAAPMSEYADNMAQGVPTAVRTSPSTEIRWWF